MNKLDQKMWGFAPIWNAGLSDISQRPMKVRDNIWASELGKAPIDLWLKMRAIEPTNPPNPRSMRKFEAGNVFEWIVSLILKRAGILQESQKWSSYQYPGLLEVTGKADFIAGGKPDIQKFEQEMINLELPDVFKRNGEKIIKYFANEFPEGLTEMPLEIKSVSSFIFEALEKNKSASKMHRLQTFHYLKSTNKPIATIVYICRDDLRMMEFLVENPSETETEYKEFIEKISKYHLSNERPPLEKAIEFSNDLGKFAKNFNVAYSGYLTMLYGFKDQAEFDAKHTPIVARWNRVLARIKAGDNITDKNKDVIKEIEDAGHILNNLIINFVSDEQKNENN